MRVRMRQDGAVGQMRSLPGRQRHKADREAAERQRASKGLRLDARQAEASRGEALRAAASWWRDAEAVSAYCDA